MEKKQIEEVLMENYVEYFLSQGEQDDWEEASLHRIVSQINQDFLSNYHNLTDREYGSMMMDFWDAFREFDKPQYSRYQVITACRQLVLENQLIITM